jgi:transaldolase
MSLRFRLFPFPGVELDFTKSFIELCSSSLLSIDKDDIDAIAIVLCDLRERDGRLFLIGSGGGAGHSSHAASDFRKICNIEAYAPYDNVSELTARINDDGWESTLVNWLKVSRFSSKDCLFVFSVGGGDSEKNISANLVAALAYGRKLDAKIVGVVGKDGGYAKKVGDAVVVIPNVAPTLVTPITEGLQAVVWHLLVSHPLLVLNQAKWESLSPTVHDQQENSKRHLKEDFTTKIFADGANKDAMLALNKNPVIAGFTTNPTLMRKAGIVNYRDFAIDILSVIKDKPISFEVFSDEFAEMERQAREIASWGDNVYVKIPITNTRSESSIPLIELLGKEGVKLNVTAIMTVAQVQSALKAVIACPAAYISVFAGRIADTGVDPLPLLEYAVELLSLYPHVELIWASPREILNVTQASQIGCHIITITDDILKKLSLAGKDHEEYSLETVRMFYDDAKACGFSIAADAELAR